MQYRIAQDDTWKMLQSTSYNYIFNLKTGYFARWGDRRENDPEWSPFGPEILDLEISTGECLGKCRFCSPHGTLVNTPYGKTPIENVKVDDYVIGFDIDDGYPQLQRVIETYTHHHDGELIQIELENGRVLSLTPEHEVFTQNRGWVAAQNLLIEDQIQNF